MSFLSLIRDFLGYGPGVKRFKFFFDFLGKVSARKASHIVGNAPIKNFSNRVFLRMRFPIRLDDLHILKIHFVKSKNEENCLKKGHFLAILLLIGVFLLGADVAIVVVRPDVTTQRVLIPRSRTMVLLNCREHAATMVQ
jgi:hypothetical protein